MFSTNGFFVPHIVSLRGYLFWRKGDGAEDQNLGRTQILPRTMLKSTLDQTMCSSELGEGITEEVVLELSLEG